jgi:hypothetical protein
MKTAKLLMMGLVVATCSLGVVSRIEAQNAPARLVAGSTDGNPGAVIKGALVFANIDIDLGTIPEGEAVNVEYPVRNISSRDVKIDRVAVTCGCTAPRDNPEVIKAGETAVIRATFNSRGRPGQQQRALTVHTDDPDQPEYRLNFRANVITEVQIPRQVIDFGTIESGEESRQRFTIISHLEKPLNILGVTTTDARITASKVDERRRTPEEGGGLEHIFEAVVPAQMPQGDLNVRVNIQTDYAPQPEQWVALRGTVAGEFTYSPSRVTIVMEKGQDIARRVAFNSRKGRPFKIVSVNHDLGVPADFEIEPGAGPDQQIVMVRVSNPDLEVRGYTGRLKVSVMDADSMESTLDLPFFINVREPRRVVAPAPAQGAAARPSTTLPVQGPAAPPPAARQ